MEELSLGNLEGGAAIERFDSELKKVLKNIADPNCPAIAKRKVILELTIKPSKERDLGDVTTKITSKLAGIEPTESRINIDDQGDGEVLAYERIKESSSTVSYSIYYDKYYR
jgi:hypothetical protein